MEAGMERHRVRKHSKETKTERKQPKQTSKCVFVCDSVCLTYTAGYGAVPLCQGIGNCQTLNGTRSLQHITWTALKADHSANSKVVTHTAAISGLRD